MKISKKDELTNELVAVTIFLSYANSKVYEGLDENLPSPTYSPGDAESYREALKDMVKILDKKGIISFDRCSKCGAYFLTSDPIYKVDADTLLCDSCWEKEYPVKRNWYIHILETNENTGWTNEEIENLSEEQLEQEALASAEKVDSECYYTEA